MSETSIKTKNAEKKSIVGISSLIVFSVLLVCWIAGFASRLFAVIRFESIIHEFDPW
jgi:dolichyl-diphosphooligosaccharide---protein glycosyltransferase